MLLIQLMDKGTFTKSTYHNDGINNNEVIEFLIFEAITRNYNAYML